jgi:hypothetical protein
MRLAVDDMSKLESEKAMFRKVTVFEGYLSSDYEAVYLSRKPECLGKSRGESMMRKWLRRYLKQLLEEKPEARPDVLRFEHVMPRQVLKGTLESLDTKFRFRITVEAEPADGGETASNP